MPHIKHLLETLGTRAPAKKDIQSVFNFVLFVVFSWSIRGFLFELSSFLLYFKLADISAILFYMLGFAMLESVFITGGLVVGSILLPSKWFKVGFVYKGFLFIFVSTIALIFYQGYYKFGFFETLIKNDYSTLMPLFLALGISLFALFWLFWLFNKPGLRSYLLKFIEQFGVFGYIYIPLGLMGIVVVIIRNLL